MRLVVALVLLYANVLTLPVHKERCVDKHRMKMCYTVNEDSLTVHAVIPSKGWEAIGFNGEHQLEGTDLYMFCVDGNEFHLEDHLITSPGVHKTMRELGVDTKVHLLEGMEEKEKTRVSFSIPLKANDSFHCQLVNDKIVYLTLAYSDHDDFNQHSVWRETFPIRL